MPAPSTGILPDPWRIAAWRTVRVALLFCLIVSTILVANHFASQALDPLTSPEIKRLKEALIHHPADDELKRQVRELDLALRQNLARHQALQARGAWLLLAGAALAVGAATYATRKRRLPKPVKDTAEASVREADQAQGAIAAVALLLVGTALWWSSHTATRLQLPSAARLEASPTDQVAAAMPETASTPFPAAEEVAHNWYRFRGPGGAGVALHTNLALAWNVEQKTGVLWKTPVPLSVPNSPVVWENRVFLTGANARKREVYCFDGVTGKLLWQQPVEVSASASAEPPTVMEDSGGFAPATAATDGRRVYAIFANGDIAAVNLAGKLVWARNLGRPENHYGHSSSLEFYQDRLLVQFDQGEAKEGKSRLLALNSLTGETAWESSPRPVPNSWSTPIVVHDGTRSLVVTTGNPWVLAHDVSTGAELWRAKVLTGEVTPSPILAGGLILAAMESEKLSAIRPDGSGDVTATHVVWQAEDGLPDITSPLSDGERVYLLNTYGLFTCYALADGRKLWEHDFEIGFHASPSLVGDRVLLVSDEGVAVVVAAADTFQELGRSEIGEPVLASPAFAQGRVYIRGKQHLFGLGTAQE
jgi:outer membrane protein assembly factor BamB